MTLLSAEEKQAAEKQIEEWRQSQHDNVQIMIALRRSASAPKTVPVRKPVIRPRPRYKKNVLQ